MQVLSHYDEVKKEGPRLTLGQGGTAKSEAEGGEAEGEKKKVLESLQVEVKDASEYYTTEEMAKFKKPKKVISVHRPLCVIGEGFNKIFQSSVYFFVHR